MSDGFWGCSEARFESGDADDMVDCGVSLCRNAGLEYIFRHIKHGIFTGARVLHPTDGPKWMPHDRDVVWAVRTRTAPTASSQTVVSPPDERLPQSLETLETRQGGHV